METTKHRTVSTVYIMIGPPCSGKSTLSKELVSDDIGILRLNRDELRSMLRGKYVVGDKLVEALVTEIINFSIDRLIRSGNDVVIDATNCKQKTINNILKVIPEGYSPEVKYIVCDIPYWKQRWRNLLRYLTTGIWIPRHIAKVMHYNFLALKEKLNL